MLLAKFNCYEDATHLPGETSVEKNKSRPAKRQANEQTV
jgi:hypothetical protein